MKNRNLILLFVGLAAGGMALVACCGGLAYLGMGPDAEETQQKLERDPEFVQHVGLVLDCQMDFWAGVHEPEDDVRVYNIKGTRWSGRVKVKRATGMRHIVWARFALPTGKIVELTPEAPRPIDQGPDKKADGSSPGF